MVAEQDLLELDRVHDIRNKRLDKSESFREKFAMNEDTGSFVMKADAMPNRFDSKRMDDRPIPGQFTTLNDPATQGSFGNAEWFEEQRTLSAAYLIKSQGKKLPSRLCNRLYPDTLAVWVKRNT